MKNIKYSIMRKKYNHYLKIRDFYDYSPIAFFLFPFAFLIGGSFWGKNNILSICLIIIGILLTLYFLIGGFLNIDDTLSYQEYCKIQSYKQTKKTIKKNKKWLI